jgi:hypothetical protein
MAGVGQKRDATANLMRGDDERLQREHGGAPAAGLCPLRSNSAWSCYDVTEGSGNGATSKNTSGRTAGGLPKQTPNGWGERRAAINTWVTTRVALALARLARHHGVTTRQTLERLIVAAEDRITARLDPTSGE